MPMKNKVNQLETNIECLRDINNLTTKKKIIINKEQEFKYQDPRIRGN